MDTTPVCIVIVYIPVSIVQVCLLHFQVMLSLSHSIFRLIVAMWLLLLLLSLLHAFNVRSTKHSHGSQMHSKRMAHPLTVVDVGDFSI